jgi:hypothetical protein
VDPYDYFSMEAARELGRGSTTDVSYRKLQPPPPIDWAELQADLFPGVSFGEWEPSTAAVEMVEVGLRDAAVALILEGAAGQPSVDLLHYLREAHEAGLADVGARLAVRLRGELGLTYAQAPKDLMRLAYPVDYVMLLDAEAAANGLDPLFFAALIRQESFWDAAAGSHAGALGLTQVIPPTGEVIAQSLGVEFSPEDLFRPAVSLKFGRPTSAAGPRLRQPIPCPRRLQRRPRERNPLGEPRRRCSRRLRGGRGLRRDAGLRHLCDGALRPLPGRLQVNWGGRRFHDGVTEAPGNRPCLRVSVVERDGRAPVSVPASGIRVTL